MLNSNKGIDFLVKGFVNTWMFHSFLVKLTNFPICDSVKHNAKNKRQYVSRFEMERFWRNNSPTGWLKRGRILMVNEILPYLSLLIPGNFLFSESEINVYLSSRNMVWWTLILTVSLEFFGLFFNETLKNILWNIWMYMGNIIWYCS